MGVTVCRGYSLYGREYIGLRGYEKRFSDKCRFQLYRSNASDASLYSKLTMELRYPISLAQSATIYALAFMEAGNSWYELKDFEPFNLYRSAGVGLRVFLPMFRLLIDWGYGFDSVPGTSGSCRFTDPLRIRTGILKWICGLRFMIGHFKLKNGFIFIIFVLHMEYCTGAKRNTLCFREYGIYFQLYPRLCKSPAGTGRLFAEVAADIDAVYAEIAEMQSRYNADKVFSDSFDARRPGERNCSERE